MALSPVHSARKSAFKFSLLQENFPKSRLAPASETNGIGKQSGQMNAPLYKQRLLCLEKSSPEWEGRFQRHLPFLANDNPRLCMLGHKSTQTGFISVSIRSCAGENYTVGKKAGGRWRETGLNSKSPAYAHQPFLSSSRSVARMSEFPAAHPQQGSYV